MRLPRCFDRLSNLVTALHCPARAVGLPYHGSRMIHSRIVNADIQTFEFANSEGQETIETMALTSFEQSFVLLDGLGQAHVW